MGLFVKRIIYTIRGDLNRPIVKNNRFQRFSSNTTLNDLIKDFNDNGEFIIKSAIIPVSSGGIAILTTVKGKIAKDDQNNTIISIKASAGIGTILVWVILLLALLNTLFGDNSLMGVGSKKYNSSIFFFFGLIVFTVMRINVVFAIRKFENIISDFHFKKHDQ